MMGKRMHGLTRALAPCLLLIGSALSCAGASLDPHISRPKNFQETGFLNRNLELHGTAYHFQVYLPEDFRRDDHKHWPIILFLHGRGERGEEGMWQTQVGLPSSVRDHPERWPFIIVMPQCPQDRYWTDPEMLAMAMAALNQETAEFHADAARTYLTGLSLGGYGSWELARAYPTRWAAIAIAAGGIFWSYAPERWHEANTLPAEYARAIGHTPVWTFHGSDDRVVPVREDELMYAALKASGGHIRYWVYQSLRHDCWFRAFNEPDLPRWLLSHRLDPKQDPGPYAERVVIPPAPARAAPDACPTGQLRRRLSGRSRNAGRHHLPARPISSIKKDTSRRDHGAVRRIALLALLPQRLQPDAHCSRTRSAGPHHRADLSRRPPRRALGEATHSADALDSGVSGVSRASGAQHV